MRRSVVWVACLACFVFACSDDTSPLGDASIGDAEAPADEDASMGDAIAGDAIARDGGDDCPPGPMCTEPGRMCGAFFESPGKRCVAPENVWVQCSYVRGLPGEHFWCPPDPPVAGSVCCVISPAPRPDECPYPSVTMRCVGDHWTEI